MHRNTQLVGTAFVVATLAISASMIVFGYINKLIHFLSFIFFAAAALAFWSAFGKHELVEFAIGVMYAAGTAIAILMIRRTAQNTPAKIPPAQHDSDSHPT